MSAASQQPKRIRVVVVDDSGLMRKIICKILAEDPDIEVVGQAANVAEARAAIKALDPDVVTLDVEMPDMNGVDFLEKLMTLRPTRVIMVSSFTLEGADLTIKALELGAIDCIAKPRARDTDGFTDLAQKIKAAAISCLPSPGSRRKRAPTKATYGSPSLGSVVAIGSSTGGVEALIRVLSEFPENCPPTVVTQHMPAGFTRTFADRLNRLCPPAVAEATDGAPLAQGQIYLAPGGAAHLEVAVSDRLRCRLVEKAPVNNHRPSIDVLFESVAKAIGRNAIGAILTGMGRDGAAGLLSIRQAGGRTIGQDEESCVIYGMPKAAAEIGAVEKQMALDDIAAGILFLSMRREDPAKRSVTRTPK